MKAKDHLPGNEQPALCFWAFIAHGQFHMSSGKAVSAVASFYISTTLSREPVRQGAPEILCN